MDKSMILSQLQTKFGAALRYQASDIEQHVSGGLFSAEQVIQLYRNNFVISCCDALQASFPVTHKLVGEDFFTSVARQWVLSNPPQSGNIIDYGEGFASWLAELPQSASLPYVASIAQLEWVIEQTASAEMVFEPFPFADLSALPATQYSFIRFHLAPQFSLCGASEAIYPLYQMAQQDQFEAINLNMPSYVLLQKQPDFTVSLQPLDEADYQFLLGCTQGLTLANIAEQLGIDPSHYVQTYIAQGVLNRFSCLENEYE
ncbi:HvfC/BufC N-terminal domain-containing protein [Motilimonas sp. 1_MG-2023]|uniref:HvfC/BufC N-terminal domain-containing protein n=1 Tax=Motilimonas TaxID=1914248 RepID=UPI0026E3FD36|nr:DNA-binding domain-containing protein [Motilimonas sp. 1_MG-2023]MDO6525901.1 DNA-binding domain-containing protein [Motilimonas sp. 1_MG-2023]